MILLDAYALIALIADEAAADEVEQVLRSAESVGIVSVNLAEAVDTLLRREKVPMGEVQAVIEPLLAEAVEVVEAGQSMAWRTARMRAAHYKRRTSELSLADCFLLAAASENETIATGDGPLQAAAKREGLGLMPLE